MKPLFTIIISFLCVGVGFSQYFEKDWNGLTIIFSYVNGHSIALQDDQHQTYANLSLLVRGELANSILRNGPISYNGSIYPGWKAGPIANTYNPAYDLRYERIWAVSKEQIQQHIAQHQLPGYQMPEVIMNWPAHGDIVNGEPLNIAPFVDLNGNGSYDPYFGEYPVIKGDFGIYFIANSQRNALNDPDTLAINLEYSGLYYLKQGMDAIFVDAKLTNKESQNFVWIEPSFYFASNPDTISRFYTDSLTHTVMLNDSSVLTHDFRRYAFTHLCNNELYKSMPIERNKVFSDPDVFEGFRLWNGLNDKWYPSGSPLYLPPSLEYSGTPTKFYAPYGLSASDSIKGKNIFALLAKTRITDIPPGESIHLKGVLHTVEVTSYPVRYNVPEEILQQANLLRNSEADNGNCLNYLNTSNFPTTEFSVYPNPASTVLHLKGITDNSSIEFTDVYGHTLISHSHAGTVDVSHLNPGLYILRVRNNKNAAPILQSKVIINR